MNRILYKIKLMLPAGVKEKLADIIPNRFLNKLKEGEVWIISYPKCGRSWLKLMLCDIVYKQFPDFERIDDVSTELLYKVNESIPRILFTHDDDPMLKSVDQLEQNKEKYQETKVVFLVRDPRDVIVSWYFEYKNRSWNDKGYGIKDDTIGEFMKGDVGGLKTIVSFYNLWLEKSHVPKGYMMLKYEDLISDSKNALYKLIDFAGFSSIIDEENIGWSIEKNSFKNVQLKEKQGLIKNSQNKVQEFGATIEGKDESLKARKGKVGGYVEYFSSEEISYMDEYIAAHLNKVFGY